MFVSSLLPTHKLCSACQLSKSLPFEINSSCYFHVLDLVHCDLWGPSPVDSTDGYRYYILFIDDFSYFTWFYPLKSKADVFDVIFAFVTFFQTQFSSKLKTFQSDGGTEFINHKVRNLFLANGTHHQISYAYSP